MQITVAADPQTVAYCHCADCKRWTGAPLPAFAALGSNDAVLSETIAEKCYPSGVSRRNCPACGSPLTARFPYLPDQIYVPLGLFEEAEDLPPQLHCHAENAYTWLHQSDALPRETGSARDTLKEAGQ